MPKLGEYLYPDPDRGPFALREQRGRFEIYHMSDPDKLLGRAPDLNRARAFVDALLARGEGESMASGRESEMLPGATVDPNAPPEPQPVTRSPGRGDILKMG